MDDYRKSKFTEQLFVILFGRSSLRATPSWIRKSMQEKEEKMEFLESSITKCIDEFDDFI